MSFRGDPFSADAVRYCEDGAVLINDRRIETVGPAQEVIAAAKDAPVVDYSGALIMAGFVDAHIHYPQMDMIGAQNNGLLDWLSRHTFPQEGRFEDAAVAKEVASAFIDECLRNGVTSACVYGTVHRASVDEFFKAAAARNICMAAGKVCMDRGAPTSLCDTAQSAHDDSQALIATWHGRGRALYAITPRFAITSTPEQLEALGALWNDHPSVLMQTHLAETHDEIAQVRALFPNHHSYYDVYRSYGLSGKGAIFGHCIHLTDHELRALREDGASIAHCPTSNAFLGAGAFDIAAARRAESGVKLCLGSDVGAGVSFSMFTTMKGAYEAARGCGMTLSAGQLFWLATTGGAAAMQQDGKIGNLTAGADADIVVIDVVSTPLIARRVAQADSLEDILMAQIIMADERAVMATYVAGEVAYVRNNGKNQHKD